MNNTLNKEFMETLTKSDLDLILESLKYTKLKFEEYPIGEKGYPSYQYKQKRIDEVNAVISEVSKIRSSSNK